MLSFMTPRLRVWLTCALLTGGLFAIPLTGSSREAEPVSSEVTAPSVKRQPGRRESRAVLFVVNMAERKHYNRREIDDTISAELFDAYFELLDPQRYYFLASDLERFSSLRHELDDQLHRGNLDFAFDVFELFLKRVSERLAFVKAHVSDLFDFTTDETIALDRTEEPWAASAAELDAAWLLRIKNELLLQELGRESSLNDDSDTGTTDDRFRDPEQSPAENVIRRYSQYRKFFGEYDTADILEYYIGALLQTFDPHSTYLNWRSLEDFDIQMRLSLKGIGATLKSVDGYTEVVNVIKGGPAERQGQLQPGDRIIAVAQGAGEAVGVIDMPLNRVVRQIRGETGTEVRLTVIKTLHGVPRVISIIRDEVKLTEQEAHGHVRTRTDAHGDKVKLGIIDLPSFYADFAAQREKREDAKSTSVDVKRIIDGMLKDEISGLLIDLRSNGGGSLEEAIKLTGLLIPEGPVVQVRETHSTRVRADRDGGFAYDIPLVVLVNRSSASASEIFAGAIQDYGRGVIVGDATTHGKGTVQTVLSLGRFQTFRNDKAGAMKYTIAKFYRVTGASTQRRGVTPDCTFSSFLDHMEMGEENLPTALPWDEIPPQKIDRPRAAVGAVLPELQRRFTSRLAADQHYQKLVTDIERYGRYKTRKTISLNKNKRIELREDDEYFATRLKDIFGVDSGTDASSSTDNAKEDIFLEHSLNVLLDLIALSPKTVAAHTVSESKRFNAE